MNFEDFRFNQSRYERPTGRHVCGRAGLWQKPCWQGPDAKGRCGGAAECSPIKQGDRYQCTRPEHAGGPCERGPLPDGACCNSHPPCRPRLSLRAWRGRLSLLAALFALALIAAFSLDAPDGPARGALNGPMANPGPISSQHAAFADGASCSACHAAHEQGPVEWFLSAFRHQDLTDGCMNCHHFEGQPRAAHQTRFEDRDDVPEVECVACHTEHQGSEFALADVSGQVCANCHLERFTDFEQEHPPFADDYPYRQPQLTYFNHARHLGEYFVDEKWLAKPNRDRQLAALAAESCTTCHAVEGASRDVKPKAFEQMCAGCHAHQISDRQMIVMTQDEISEILLPLVEVGEEGEADAEELAAEVREQMLENGSQALEDLASELDAKLWRGLNALEAQSAARAWAEDEDYEPMAQAQQAMSGWHVGENADGDQAVFYQVEGHADPVMKAWIEHFLQLRRAGERDVDEALEVLLDASQGAGACGKCHAAGLLSQHPGIDDSASRWGYVRAAQRRHTHYSHVPHISLMGSEEGCDTCHSLDSKADFDAFFEQQGADAQSYRSGFESMRKETCVACHSRGRIASDCGLCHRYHSASGYRVGFMSRMDPKEAGDVR